MDLQAYRTLEAKVRALFKSWFVDFLPVRAKIAARTQTGDLKPDIAALFPDAFQDSELGEIPEWWKVGTVADAAEFNSWTLGKKDKLDTLDYIEISKVMQGDIAEITRYNRGEEPSRARRRLKHGDTALSTVRPDRGACFLCLNPPEALIASTGFAVATRKNGYWAFVHATLTQDEIGEELGRKADGGAYPANLPEVIASIPLALPTGDTLLQQFERVAVPLLTKAASNRSEASTFAALRDALLPKPISGELRAPDADKQAKESL